MSDHLMFCEPPDRFDAERGVLVTPRGTLGFTKNAYDAWDRLPCADAAPGSSADFCWDTDNYEWKRVAAGDVIEIDRGHG